MIELLQSFNAGELSPMLDARTSLEKYKSGCATLQNFVIMPYGGVNRRPGLEYLGSAKYSDKTCRLLGFNFSTTTRFVLEIGHLYMRFFANRAPIMAAGGGVLEIVTPYQEADLKELQFCQINDVLYIAHSNYHPYKLSRIADNNWTIQKVTWDFPPLLDENTTDTTISASGGTGNVTLTASTAIFKSGHVGSQWGIQWPRRSSGASQVITGNWMSPTIDINDTWDLTTFGTWNATIRLLRTPQSVQDKGIIVATATRSGTIATVTHTAHGYSTGDNIFVGGSGVPFDTWLSAITVTGPNTYTYAVANSGATSATIYPENISQMEVIREWTSASDRNVSATGTETNRAGLKIQILNYVSNTNGRVVLESRDFRTGGTVTINTVAANGLSATATVNKWLGTNFSLKTTFWSEGAFSDARGYPKAVAIHQQRICYAGTSSRPNTIWCSSIDDFENFLTGALDTNSMRLTLSASEGNRINWMQSQQQLLIGTSGDEWSIGASDTAKAFSASNVIAKRQSSYGSKYMRAAMVNDVLLFVQRSGRKVRELVYSFQKDGWVAADLTLLAEHITKGELTEIAYQQQPDAILWGTTGNGVLTGMTYERDQTVVGWHRHKTDGKFESVATIYGNGTEDEVWTVVNRTINGSSVRTIESFSLNWRNYLEAEDKANWFYVDCGKKVINASPTATITGLTHLIGKTVSILADGAQHPSQTVSATGTITLNYPATTVVVGLPYESILQPMKFDAQLQDGTAQGRKQRTHRARVRFYKSLGGDFSTDGVTFDVIPARDINDRMDDSPPVFTGEKHLTLASGYSDNATLYIRQTNPMPMTVIAIITKWEAFGE